MHRVSARKEILLSAGTINSPQLLMLSGIGDKAALSELGINAIVDLPSVGKNMSDHTLLSGSWYVNSNDTFAELLAPDKITAAIAQWNATHKGPLSYMLSNHIAWLRLPKDDPIFQTYRDPTPGPTSAHYELFPLVSYAICLREVYLCLRQRYIRTVSLEWAARRATSCLCLWLSSHLYHVGFYLSWRQIC